MHSGAEEDPDWDEEDEEMPATERELADDAQWKLIQKNTFTRWANEHLKTVNKHMGDLEVDLSDGLRLIGLIEVLSGKKFRHANKRPNFRTQKLENVTMVLEFLERDEGIRIVNIDSGDIVDHKLKLILGLIWTLILHYSISMPMWEGEEPGPQEGGPTPKQRLMNWIQSKTPDIPIKNFSSDWNDGRAIGALVDAVGPGLCPDWEDWDPKNAKKNAKEAMEAAEKWLDVPQLIKPEELVNPKCDEMSMMTYLSQFPRAKLKPGAPLRPRLNAARVRAYGPGLEPTGNQVGAPARFTVETFSAGKGTLDITVINPKGKNEKVEIVFNEDRNLTYSCMYTPSVEGEYRVVIKFGGKEIPKSPYTVKVEGQAGDPTKVSAKGPGIEKTGVIATKRTYFEVFTKAAGTGRVDVAILDPHGRRDTVRPSIKAQPGQPDTFLVEYVPREPGLHSINVFFSGHQIPNSPYGVGVAAVSNAKACFATGRGIQPRGIRVRDNADFKVHTKDAGEAEVKIQIIGPGGMEVKCTMVKSTKEEGVFDCVYIPTKPGQYVINISFGDQPITKSPFKVEVKIQKETKIVAFGPGLEGGVVNQPAVFTVETNGEVGALGFSIEGPSQAKIDCKDNGDGSADVTYLPTAPGEYAVHILCNEEDIPKSPYMAQIRPATKEFDAGKVIAKGPGLEKTGVIVSKWAEFTVDARQAGKATLKISCIEVSYKQVEVQIKDNRDGTYTCRYMPRSPVKHTITITWGGVQIPKSPFRVQVQEPSKPGDVKVYGPGVEKGVKTNVVTFFTVDCKTAGPGDVAIALTDERGKDVPVHTTDNGDGTFKVEYKPVTPGKYTVGVFFADKEIPSSPISVTVEASLDLSKVKVEGLESPVIVGEERDVKIITEPAGKSNIPSKMHLTSPRGKLTEVPLKPIPEGFTGKYKLNDIGPHKATITYAAIAVPGYNPYMLQAIVAPTVRAYGPGLKGGKTNEPCKFTVDTREAGVGPGPSAVSVGVDGPAEAKIDVVDNKNGTLDVTYYPVVPGNYNVNVLYAKKPIKDSPFLAKVEPAGPESKVKAYGPGLTSGKAFEPATFTVDTREVGPGPAPGGIGVSVEGPAEAKIDCVDNKDGTCTVTYFPVAPGEYDINVLYANKPIKDSPFKAKIAPGEPKPKVKAYGPGLTSGKAFEPAKFTVDTREAGPGPGGIGVSIEGPAEAKIDCVDNQNGTIDVTYYPLEPGEYKVNVLYDNKPIDKSPFTAKIAPGEAKPKVKAYGPGLTGGKAFEPAEFTIDTREVGPAPGGIGVSVEGPAEAKIDCVDNQNGTCSVTYYPVQPGEYDVNVTYDSKPIPGSPFKAKIEPGEPRPNVKAYGPGLTSGQAYKPARFTIDTREAGPEPGGIGVSVEGPSEAKINCNDNQNGTCDVTYYPVAPGDYKVNVLYANKPIPKSPFTAKIEPGVPEAGPNLNAVKAYGPGLEPKGVFLDSPTEFTVDATEVPGVKLGEAPVRATITSPSGAVTDTFVKNNGDGTYRVLYTPSEQGTQSIDVSYDSATIPKSPFVVNAVPGCDPSRVKAYGPGLEGGVTKQPAEFTVDVKGAGQGGLALAIDGPCETPINCKDNRDGTCKVEYFPEKPGDYNIAVKFAEQDIPGSPFRVDVKNPVNPEKVKCYGPGLDTKGVRAGQPATFTVDPTEAGEAPLEVTYTDPVGNKRPAEVRPVADGKFEATYFPVDEGKCKVEVKYANQQVPHSPFQMEVLPGADASKVRVTGPGVNPEVLASLPVTFTIDCRDAGVADLEVVIQRPDGTFVRPIINDNGDGTFNVTYAPEDLGPYNVQVKFGGKPVPNSPFTVAAKPTGDASKCRITDGLEKVVPVNKDTVITVDASQAGMGKVTCRIRSPTGTEIDIDILDNPDGTFSLQFTPQYPGPYSIEIKFGGVAIPEGAYTIQVGDDLITPEQAGGVQSQRPDTAYKPVDFRIPVGPIFNFVSANVTMPSGKKGYPKIEDNKDGTVTIRYQPTEVGCHELQVNYNNVEIEGSPFKFHVDNINSGHVTAFGPGLSHGVTNEPAEFTIITKDAGAGGLSLAIEGPSKTEIKCKDNEDGTCTVSYIPTAPGEYNITVKFADKHISGSPFVAKITHTVEVQMQMIEKQQQVVQQQQQQQQQVIQQQVMQQQQQTQVQTQQVQKFEQVQKFQQVQQFEQIQQFEKIQQFEQTEQFQSKQTQQVIQQAGEPRKKAQIGRSSEVSLKVTETDMANLTASIRSPSGQEEKCILKRLPNGHLGISFTPREVGEHLVNVFRNDQHIANSPFKIMVGESELGNAGKVRVFGDGLDRGMANEVNEFTVDTRDAGYGGLSLSIEGPSKADIECHDNEDGSCRVTYKPTEPGTYIINIKFADEHVPGSPFTVKIGGEGSSRITERITRHREAADITHIGSQCELSLKIPASFKERAQQQSPDAGTSPFDMTATVVSPNGVSELCDVASLDDCHYSIKFVPKEMGVHTVSVKHKDMHIPGSPFEFTVGPITGGGPHKVHAAGPGLQRGEINQPCEFNIYTREAGAGGLSIAVEGPSKAEMDFEDRKDGSCGVTYSVTEPGEYLASIKFNDQHIPDSPFRVQITPSIGDARKLSVSALQSKGLQIGKPAAFVVNYNGAQKGNLQARVTGPSGTEDEALVQEVDDGEYAVRFIPRENGYHLVHVQFNGNPIPDSPFRVLVGKVDSDPGMVQASGDGLRTARVGEVAKFMVNTVNAGAGALGVTVEGPSKVKLECREVEEGYEFTYTPTCPGDYLITIRYAGSHIAGSPFKAHVEGEGKPSFAVHEQASVVVETVTKSSTMSRFSALQKFQSDASRVVAEGNGLKKAFRGKQTTFTVDATAAGHNMMFVGMMGPKGPCEELIVKNQGGNVYKVTYTVKERGDYMLIVKWGDEGIPGSPFLVRCD